MVRQNKLTKTVQECILDAFHSKEIGGVNGLIEWGKQMGNREAFYKLVSRLIPIAEADKRINGKKKQEEKKARLGRLREGVKKHDSKKEEWDWEPDKIELPTLESDDIDLPSL